MAAESGYVQASGELLRGDDYIHISTSSGNR